MVKSKSIYVSFVFCLLSYFSYGGCAPSITNYTEYVTAIEFDNFGDLMSGITKNGCFSFFVSTTSGCPWDLFVSGVTLTQQAAFSSEGITLPLSSINVRAVNNCTTPNQVYPPVNNRITGNFTPAFTAASPYYLVGTSAVNGDIPATFCAASTINDVGTPVGNPSTNQFRFDFDIIPGLGTGAANFIQPGIYVLNMNITVVDDGSGIPFQTISYQLNITIDEILSLNVATSNQVNFTFSALKDYTSGVTNYSATKLTVNSTVSWDLMAIGTSSNNESSAGTRPYWDMTSSYAGVGTPNIPLDVLELFQSPINPTTTGPTADYSSNFTIPPSGNNNIAVGYLAGGVITGVGPAGLERTIAGDWGAVGAGHNVAPGSYQAIAIAPATWIRSNYSYLISYRLTPGLPPQFSYSKLGIGNIVSPSFAQPGTYTMQVKYILSEDQ